MEEAVVRRELLGSRYVRSFERLSSRNMEVLEMEAARENWYGARMVVSLECICYVASDIHLRMAIGQLMDTCMFVY
jgi:hypothetical protein